MWLAVCPVWVGCFLCKNCPLPSGRGLAMVLGLKVVIISRTEFGSDCR